MLDVVGEVGRVDRTLLAAVGSDEDGLAVPVEAGDGGEGAIVDVELAGCYAGR